MARYIDAEQKITVTYYDEEHEEWSKKSKTIDDFLYENADDEIPTADVVEVRHGKWIYTKKRLVRGGYVDASECSVCKKRIMPHIKPNFCPNCGARMEVTI